MTRLAVRRFPHEIIRARTGASMINEYGEPSPGAVTHKALRANLQPVSRQDLDLVGGDRLLERITAYVPGADSLLAIRESAPGDKVMIVDRGTFVVESSASWDGSHTRAVLLREE